MTYDAIIGLGSFCQVSGALWLYELKNINSPLDNFGIKTWQSVIPLLETRFEDYWDLENMTTGKVVNELSNKYGEKRPLMKVYDNKYNLVSNHNFLEEENPNGEIKTYTEFRESLELLEAIFLKQCEEYNKVRFVLKAMSWPNPLDTLVSENDIDRLMAILKELRGDKYFDLHIAVPEKQYEKIKKLEAKFPNNSLRVSKWTIDFNNEKHPEWDELFKDFTLDESYYRTLVCDIIGVPHVDLPSLNNF